MQPVFSHRWQLSETEAAILQTEMAALVVTQDRLPELITRVAGVDVAYRQYGEKGLWRVAVFSVATGKLEESVLAEEKVSFSLLSSFTVV